MTSNKQNLPASSISYNEKELFYICPYDKHGQTKVSIISLYKHIPGREGNSRPTQWFKRSVRKINKIRERFLLECEELNEIAAVGLSERPYVSVTSALLLLIYGENNYRTIDLHDFIANHTKIQIPVNFCFSRYEHDFNIRLNTLLLRLSNDSVSVYEYTYKRQQQIGPYRVDFYVEQRLGAEITSKYVIEFDEKFHLKPAHRISDAKRDAWMRKHYPDITIIRVRHEESSLWFKNAFKTGYLSPIEFGFATILHSASRTLNRDEFVISAASAKLAHQAIDHHFTGLLPKTRQYMQSMRTLLRRLSICFRDSKTATERTIIFKKQALKRYLSIFTLPDEYHYISRRRNRRNELPENNDLYHVSIVAQKK